MGEYNKRKWLASEIKKSLNIGTHREISPDCSDTIDPTREMLIRRLSMQIRQSDVCVDDPNSMKERLLKDSKNSLKVHQWKFRKSYHRFVGLKIAYIVVSKVECERSFSAINDIASDIRSAVGIKRIGVLMIAKLLGPKDINVFNSESYRSPMAG